MFFWEIHGEDLLWIEVYAGAAFLASLCGWVVLRKLPISLIALLVTVGVVIFGGFRPFDYNSDTRNYYSYVYMLSFVNDREIFFLTKLEPVHSALILLLRDFRLWLLAETAIAAFGLFLSFRNRRNDYSFLILCAFVLTLDTSSLRYCSALIYFYYFMSRSEVGLFKAARMTLILSCLHVSMLLSGALAVRRRLALLAVVAACGAIFFESSILGERINIDLTEASRGLKNFGVAMLAVAYLFARAPQRKALETCLSMDRPLFRCSWFPRSSSPPSIASSSWGRSSCSPSNGRRRGEGEKTTYSTALSCCCSRA